MIPKEVGKIEELPVRFSRAENCEDSARRIAILFANFPLVSEDGMRIVRIGLDQAIDRQHPRDRRFERSEAGLVDARRTRIGYSFRVLRG
jgi:hypothetical protein